MILLMADLKEEKIMMNSRQTVLRDFFTSATEAVDSDNSMLSGSDDYNMVDHNMIPDNEDYILLTDDYIMVSYHYHTPTFLIIMNYF